jgi:hypothetical protein
MGRNKWDDNFKFIFFLVRKPLKFLGTKLKIFEFYQNKFENPKILKQIPATLFPPHVKPPK